MITVKLGLGMNCIEDMQSVKNTLFPEMFTIEDLNQATQESSSKSSHDYYIMKK